MATKFIPVVGAVVWNSGRILAAQRKEGTKLGGLWEFPGGKIEAGESAKAALVREIEEELEATVDVGEMICEVDHEYDFATVRLTTFHCNLVSGDLVLNDHDDVRWLFPSELRTVEWAPADLPTIDILEAEVMG